MNLMKVSSSKDKEIYRCKGCNKKFEDVLTNQNSNKDTEIDSFSIECSGCGWLHGSCADTSVAESYYINSFHCQKCIVKLGPSTFEEFLAPHRLDPLNSDEIGLPVEIGSKLWIDKFRKHESKIPAPDTNMLIIHKDGEAFNKSTGDSTFWNKVHLIENLAGLGMKMPDKNHFNTQTLVDMFGPDHIIDVIDVYRQCTIPMSLWNLHKKFISNERTVLYNSLSLNCFTNHELKKLVSAPQFVRDVAFEYQLWPENNGILASTYDRFKPNVSIYCLTSMSGSFTNYHCDFSGTSVYFHVLRGEKVFYVAPPSDTNLAIYRNWQLAGETTTDLMKLLPKGQVKRFVIREGQTAIIPGGFIHAVYTSMDSIIFSGAFLHLKGTKIQLKIFDMEKDIQNAHKIEEKFLYPQFESVTLLAVKNILIPKLQDSNNRRCKFDPYLASAAKKYKTAIQTWFTNNSSADQEMSGMAVEVLAKLEMLMNRQNRIFGANVESENGEQRVLVDEEDQPKRKIRKLDNKKDL